jgi:hypothetical protein
MGGAAALRREEATESPAPSRAEFRALLAEVLSEVDRDERIGALLRAAAIRIRFHYPDLDLTLNVAATEEPEHYIRWSFADDMDPPPKLELEMNSDVANRYLQGSESLAVAIARGRVKVRGESKIALLYLPAMRLVCEPYRRIARDEYPHLASA